VLVTLEIVVVVAENNKIVTFDLIELKRLVFVVEKCVVDF
jgi:hypothetical protein